MDKTYRAWWDHKSQKMVMRRFNLDRVPERFRCPSCGKIMTRRKDRESHDRYGWHSIELDYYEGVCEECFNDGRQDPDNWEKMNRMIDEHLQESRRRRQESRLLTYQERPLLTYREKVTECERAMLAPNNVVIWEGMSSEAIAAIINLIKTNRIAVHPSNYLVYLYDGRILPYPIARSRRPYKTAHWLPVVFSLVRTKSGRIT